MCEISEDSLFEDKQCVKVDYCSRSTSSESCAESYTNEIALSPPKEIFQIGDVTIEQSQNVHVGQKNLYENCNIRVVNYLNDLSEISNFPKESTEFENKIDYFQESNSENKFKLWFQKDVKRIVILIGVFVILYIASILLSMYLNTVSYVQSPNESETTIPTTQSSTVETTTFDYENTSTSPFTTTTDTPKKNKCPPSAKELFTSKIDPGLSLQRKYFTITSREEWNASEYKYERIKLENPEYVIVSHTLQEHCYSETACIDRVQTLQKFDRTVRKLDDIRYNFLIGGNGDIFEGRGWDVVGQHTENYDNRSLGIAFIIDSNKYDETHEQVFSFGWLLREGVRNKKLREDYKLIGRCQVVFSTDSPGTYVYYLVSTEDHWIPDPLIYDES